MKVEVKKFAIDFKSWSNKNVANLLYNIIRPKNANSRIELSRLQANLIYYYFHKIAIAPTFKDLYQQLKSIKISSVKLVDDKTFRLLNKATNGKLISGTETYNESKSKWYFIVNKNGRYYVGSWDGKSPVFIDKYGDSDLTDTLNSLNMYSKLN